MPSVLHLVSGCDLAGAESETEERDSWAFLDAAYCLTLSDRSDRQNELLPELRRVGLLAKTTLVVSEPTSGPKPPAIFESHCAAARDALDKGYRRILILEDDVCFLRHGHEVAQKVGRLMAQLPPTWEGLYLGHFPIRAFFVAPGILRSSSGCSHAYIANEPLLRWLAGLEPLTDLPARRIPLLGLVGQGIDAALACRPGMYACFPMLAVQSRSRSSNINPDFTRSGSRRKLLDKYRYTHHAIRGMRAAQWVAALLSPWHWLRRRRWLPEGVGDGAKDFSLSQRSWTAWATRGS